MQILDFGFWIRNLCAGEHVSGYELVQILDFGFEISCQERVCVRMLTGENFGFCIPVLWAGEDVS